MEYVLKTEGLTKRYKKNTVVNDVSLSVRAGEIYGFVGKNGAGKTTFIRMILGLSPVTSGSFSFFDGEDINSAKRRIGSLVESPAFFKNMSAKSNLEICCGLLGADNINVGELLELVGLEKTGKKKAADFSLGMKQRLGIAMALAGDPDLLVLDEPINGLDPKGIVEIRELLTELKNRGKTIFISSHLLGELEKTATCYGIIAGGKLVEQISAEELLKKCGRRTVIKADDPAKASALIEKMLGAGRASVESENVFVSGEIEDIGELTSMLFKEKIRVTGIAEDDNAMEDYFLEKMEEAE